MNKTQTARFEEFYKYFPKKEARGAGEKAWEKLDPDEELAKKMTLAVQAQVRYKRQEGDFNIKFFKSAGPWLNQKCWLDEVGSHAELKEKQESTTCCLDGCTRSTIGSRFPVCEWHYQFTKDDKLRDSMNLVHELRRAFNSELAIRPKHGVAALRWALGEICR